MQSFIINSFLDKHLINITVNVKESSLLRMDLYIEQQWIGTLYKNEENSYKLLSYSSYPIEMKDLNHIGNQIDLQLMLNINNASIVSSKAA